MRPGVLAAAVVALAAGRAHAQPADAQAEALFRQGRDLLAQGKIGEACTAFAGSQKLAPAVTTLMNLASCREKNEQLATAWGLFVDAERQTRGPKDGKLHAVAADHAKKLEKRLSKLTIDVPAANKIDGLAVERDKESQPSEVWGRPLPIDGGTYTITAHAPGMTAWTSKVTIATEGDAKTIEVPKLAPVGVPTPDVAASKVAAAQPAAAPADEVVVTSHASGRGKLAPIAATAGAVVLLGAAAGVASSAYSSYDDAKAEMVDQGKRDSLYDSANTKAYLAEGLAVAGVGCAGLAVWLWLRKGDEPRMQETARRLIVSPTGVAIVGGF